MLAGGRWSSVRSSWPLVAVLAAVQALRAWLFLAHPAAPDDAGWRGFPLDDAWIHLVYARALAAGEGPAYNPGQWETGFTSPAWALLEAPLFWLAPRAADPVQAVVVGVKALGLACSVAGAVLLVRLAEALGARRVEAWTVGLLASLDPHLGFSSVSGMEVPLAAAAVAGACLALARSSWGALGLCLALAPLSRPEAALASAVVGAAALVQLARGGAPLRAWLAVAVPPVLAAGAWVGLCQVVTGRPLPMTFYVKARFPDRTALDNLEVLGRMVGQSPWWAGGVGLLLLVAGVVLLARRRRHPLALLVAVAWPWLHLAALALTHNLFDAWPYYWRRYAEPATLLAVLPLGVAAGASVMAVAQALSARTFTARAAVGLVGLGCLFVAAAALPGALDRRARLFGNNASNIHTMNVAAGLWIRDHVEAGRWVSSVDAGAVRFFGDHPVLDAIGLNDHRVVGGDLRRIERERGVVAWVVFNESASRLETPRHELAWSSSPERYTICNCSTTELRIYQARAAPLPARRDR